MKLSEFIKMSVDGKWNPDAELKAFDPESGQNQSVTGCTIDDKEIIIYTDI